MVKGPRCRLVNVMSTTSAASHSSPPEPLYSLRPRSGGICSLKYLPFSDQEAGIASVSTSGTLHLWSLNTKRSIWSETIGAPLLSVNSCCINQDRRLISQTRDGNVDVWDCVTKKKVSSIGIGDSGFCKLTTFDEGSPRSSCFVVGSVAHNKVYAYNIPSQKIEMSFTTKDSKNKGMCMCVKSFYNCSTGINYVIGGFEDGTLLLWDERNTNMELTSCQLFHEPVLCVTVDDRGRGACGSPGRTLQCFNITLDKGLIEEVYTLELKNPGIADIAVRHDKRIFATGGWDGRIRVFTWMKGKSLAVLNYHSSTVHCVKFSDASSLPTDTNLLMCGSQDEVISIWRLY